MAVVVQRRDIGANHGVASAIRLARRRLAVVTFGTLYGDGMRRAASRSPGGFAFAYGHEQLGHGVGPPGRTPNGTTTTTPVVWSYSGSPAAPVIKVVPFRLPGGTGYTAGVTVAGVTDGGNPYEGGALCSRAGPGPDACWYHAGRWTATGRRRTWASAL
ncbi:MAG TPA: hypothetical protein VG815_00180 [Chloroflexota bacterium]|jgi:hypothetical protein|nr:hypothetical protein [Chloroflexota bacterium]